MNNGEKAKLIGIKYADSLFHQFLENPEYRGVNFTWPNFPNMASQLAAASCFSSFHHNVRNLKSLEEICRKSCKERCEYLVNNTKLT